MPREIFLTLKSAIAGSALVSALVLVLAGCAGQDGTERAADSLQVDTALVGVDTAGVSAKSIYDVITEDDRFSTFAAAVDSADLDQTLFGPGPFTVFAPTNEAMSQIDHELLEEENEDELRDLVLSHISNGEKTASALSGQTIRTLAGGDLTVAGTGDSLRVGDARIVEANISAGNGVIHAVEHVLSPSMQDEGL